MRAIEREYGVASVAMSVLGDALRRDPSVLARRSLRPRDFAQTSANLEATYLVRLFAEFESTLRDVWRVLAHRRTQPRTGDLIAAIATRRGVPVDSYNLVDRVRQARNAIVHEDLSTPAPVTVAVARSALCGFLSRLPGDW
jgi:hypothetical protein